MFKKSQNNGCGVRLCACVTLILVMVSLATTRADASTFCDDFEDGDHVDWQYTVVTAANQGGDNGVEAHNGSQMAFVNHWGNGGEALSMDFSYTSNTRFSFDMQAVAVGGSYWDGYAQRWYSLQSRCGVEITFLNPLNISLGEISLVDATDVSWVPSGGLSIDNTQHHYDLTMGQWADYAGIDSSVPSAISVRFFSDASYGRVGPGDPGNSSGKVWFDNVCVGTVPEPATLSILALGGILLRKRK